MSQSQVNGLEPYKHETFAIHRKLATSEHQMMQCCMLCGKEMEFVEGDIIYGEDWYHGNCWNATHTRGN